MTPVAHPQPPDRSGCFITFEGIDGAGKSSHIEPLAQALRAQGRVVRLTREPGGTPLAEQLRALLLAQPMDALTEALLLFAARREHLLTVIEPALAQGEVLLCDRYTDASFAYQGFGRGFDLQVLQTLEQWVQASPAASTLRQPDLTLWFDLPAATAAARLAGARAPDKFEAEPLAFFERVAAGYAARCAQFPQRFERIDASLPLEQVWQQVRAVCQRRGLLDQPSGSV
ncbi:MAG: thymidylate kinase [Comamonadaceae bacterium BICA1-1]|nr:MAG: thymidylate kinase [Comamonadaceae bacterium BICA1-1]